MINKLCGSPGCNRLAVQGRYFCEYHQKKSDERKARHDEERRKDFSSFSRVDRFYNYNNPEWVKVKKAFLKKNPYCAACGSKENLQVHHIKPIRFFPELRYDESNLQTLCISCHAAITRQEINERRREKRY